MTEIPLHFLYPPFPFLQMEYEAVALHDPKGYRED